MTECISLARGWPSACPAATVSLKSSGCDENFLKMHKLVVRKWNCRGTGQSILPRPAKSWPSRLSLRKIFEHALILLSQRKNVASAVLLLASPLLLLALLPPLLLPYSLSDVFYLLVFTSRLYDFSNSSCTAYCLLPLTYLLLTIKVPRQF